MIFWQTGDIYTIGAIKLLIYCLNIALPPAIFRLVKVGAERHHSFFSWFEPFIVLWLEENDDLSMEYMYNAIDKDKKEGVSNNAFDICEEE